MRKKKKTRNQKLKGGTNNTVHVFVKTSPAAGRRCVHKKTACARFGFAKPHLFKKGCPKKGQNVKRGKSWAGFGPEKRSKPRNSGFGPKKGAECHKGFELHLFKGRAQKRPKCPKTALVQNYPKSNVSPPTLDALLKTLSQLHQTQTSCVPFSRCTGAQQLSPLTCTKIVKPLHQLAF